MPDKNLSRDPARTPMQWDTGKNAGFTEGRPWLRLDKTFARVNVQSQLHDPHSMLNLYRRLIQLRRREPALVSGNYEPVYADSQVLAFVRHSEGRPSFLVVLNLTHRPGYFRPDNFSYSGTVEIATAPEMEGSPVSNSISIDGDEGLLIRLNAPA